MSSDAGAEATRPGLRRAVRALRHPDYRRFWFGACASNIGTWTQNLAVPYVIFQTTGSALWVGLATVAQFAPAMVLTPIGGSLADRFERRRVLLLTQTAMSLAALTLWALWLAGTRTPWLLLTPVFVVGILTGLNNPSFQSLAHDLVPRDDLLSAITLNSMQFNAARAVGPAVAGVVLSTLGPSWAFLLNAASFLFIVVALLRIRTRPQRTVSATSHRGLRAGFVESIRYARGQPGILMGIGLVMLIAGLGSPIQQFTVVFAGEEFHVGVFAISVMNTCFGLGAIVIGPLVSGWDTVFSRSRVVSIALPAYGLGILAFAVSPTYHVAALTLLVAGAGFLANIATANTAVQMIVADHIRGRILAVRVMAFQGSYPLGALVLGAVADEIGPRPTVAAAGAVIVSAGLVLRLGRPQRALRRLDDDAERMVVRADSTN